MNRGNRLASLLAIGATALLGVSVPAGSAAAASASRAQCATGGGAPIATTAIKPDDELSDVAVDPVTDRVYVANLGGHSVAVLDGHTNRQIATIPLAATTDVAFVSVDAAADRVYVSGGPTIAAINGRTNRVIRSVHVGGIDTRAVADPINGLVYVASENTNTVVVVRASTETVIATVAVGIGPTALTIDARTHRVYVVNSGDKVDNGVSVISERTNKVVATIPMPYFISGVGVDTWNDTIYVIDDVDNLMWAINGRTNAVAAPTSIGGLGGPGMAGPAVDPNLDIVFVGGGPSMFGVCGHTSAVTISGSVPDDLGQVVAIAVDTASQRVYVVDNWDNAVSVFDYSSLTR